jgi:hypothetical protein
MREQRGSGNNRPGKVGRSVIEDQESEMSQCDVSEGHTAGGQRRSAAKKEVKI